MGKTRISNQEKAAFLLVLLVILVQLPQSLKPERRHRAEQKRIGLWLKQNTPADAIIMSNSPQEAFYADREFLSLPAEKTTEKNLDLSYNEVICYAKAKGVGYILVDKNTHETNPSLTESAHSSDLQEVFKKQDQALIIYKVKD